MQSSLYAQTVAPKDFSASAPSLLNMEQSFSEQDRSNTLSLVNESLTAIENALKMLTNVGANDAKKFGGKHPPGPLTEHDISNRPKTLGELADVYIPAKKHKWDATTLECKERLAARIKNHLTIRSCRLDKLTKKNVKTIIKRYMELNNLEKVGLDLKNMGIMYGWYLETFKVQRKNPFLQENDGVVKRPVPKFSVFKNIYTVASKHDKPFLLLMLLTSARREDLFCLRWRDVDLPSRKLSYGAFRRAGSGKASPRVIDCNVDVCRLLKWLHPQSENQEFVFCDPRTGAPYRARKHIMHDLCKYARINPPFDFGAISRLGLILTEVEKSEVSRLVDELVGGKTS